jgi:glycosyltransferase involved in cell wall biosynthesis
MNCRLLYLVGRLRAGGLERQLCCLLQTIDRKRYAPALAVWNFREDDFYVDQLREMDIPIYSAPARRSGPSKLRWLRSLASRLHPEVIHSYSFYTNFAAWYAAAGTKVVVVGSVRSDFARSVSEYGFCLGRLSAHWPRAQIFNNFTAAESVQKSYSLFTPRQVFVVRNGVDLERFTKTPLPSGTPVKMLAIGSLTQVKRWDRLLNAALKLKQMHFQFQIRIVGDGPLRWPLERQADDLGINNHVEFMGQRNDIPALLADTLLLAHTSQNEGCPNVVMEAMACGRPVVATDAGDIPFLVEDGKTGFVVRRGDADAFAERLAALIQNPELCERMSEAGRRKAERDFGLERLMRETLAAYQGAGWSHEGNDCSATVTIEDSIRSTDCITFNQECNTSTRR